jgi:hypothetical protein
LPQTPDYAINETRPEGAGNADEPLEHNADVGGRAMSRYGHYTPLGVILKTEHFLNVRGVRA